MPFLETPRGRFHYRSFGSGGPVVYLLHGLTAKGEDWDPIPEDLAREGFHVFTFDMRGHGQSFRPSEGFAPEDHADDVAAWSETLGHPCVHLVGHSTGGRHALCLAARRPDLAASLTVVDQTLTAAPESWKKYRDRCAEFPAPFPDEASLDAFLAGRYPGDARRFAFYKGQFRRGGDGTWNWTFDPRAAWETQRLGRAAEAFGLLSGVWCPALFVKGAESRYVGPEELDRMRAILPFLRLAVVPGAEHAVFRDNREGFLAAVVPFLKESSRKRPGEDGAAKGP